MGKHSTSISRTIGCRMPPRTTPPPYPKVKGHMHLDLRRKVFVKIRVNNVAGNWMVLHRLNQSHFGRQRRRAGLQPNQMRAFEPGHTARKFFLVKFQRNRRSFGAIQNTGNLSGTAQPASFSFTGYFPPRLEFLAFPKELTSYCIVPRFRSDKQRTNGLFVVGAANRLADEMSHGQYFDLATELRIGRQRHGIGNNQFLQWRFLDSLNRGSGKHSVSTAAENFFGTFRFSASAANVRVPAVSTMSSSRIAT